ncbi:hypothetical protein M9Y10_009940 [Tritrichomonas musculus]|uniref:SCP domain-containing protein n=1 Tax=Tritrichomonas musculus TaxID=1915356 RepID=A0ABR2IR56_9EUKA
MLLLLLFSLVLSERIKQCTPKRTLFDVTLDNIDKVVGGSRPVFLRLIKNGCPYAKTSQAYWDKAAELFPNVQFVRGECIYHPQVCSRFNAQISPSHAVIGPNSSTVRTFFTNPDEISKSTQYFSDVLSQNFQFYSFDTPSIEDLIPQNTNNFFESAPYSVFLLYDSKCYEDLDLIATWLTKVTDGKISADEIAIGKLDCGKYPDECKKWGSKYPAANVFSRDKGTSISISEFDHLQKRLDQVIEYLNQSNEVYPTPFPYPSEPEDIETEPEIENVNKLTLDNLQKRTLEEIKEKYLAAKKKEYKGEEYNGSAGSNGRCGQITMNPQIINESLKHIKFFRELAGLPNHNIRNEESQNEGCYYGAKYLTYIGRLTHSVNNAYSKYCDFGSHWTDLKNALAWSNLAQSSNNNDIWSMVAGLVKDEGDENEGVIGHRRWFLYPYLSKIGVGFYPWYKFKKPNGEYMQYPATGVWRVHDGTAYQIPYTLVNFIAYPPPGPFPINELPTSWTIYYHKFQNYDENDLSKITVKLTRDDGIPLTYQKLYLSKKNVGMTGTLIIKLSAKTLTKLTVGHGVHVQIYLLDGETRDLLDYTFTFFDFSSETQLCFYQNDINKCPETIPKENRLGPGEYQGFTQTGITRTVINVAEKITLDEPLRLNYSKNIFVKGEKILGTVICGIGYTIDFADPTQTIVQSEMDPYDFKSGVFKTSRYPKRIDIIFTREPCARNTFRTLFYVGSYTQFTYMKRAVDGEYRYFFSISNSDIDWTFVCLSVTDFEYACLGSVNDYKNYIDKNTKCTVFQSFTELKSLKTSKRVIRVYADGLLYFSASGLADGSYHDYEIYSKGDIQFQYSDKINMRARSIMVQRIEGTDKKICPVFGFRDSIYGRPKYEAGLRLFPFRNLTINGFYHNTKVQYIEEGYKVSVQGDWTAKSNLNKASNIVLQDERVKPYFNESGYFYYKKKQSETQIPIFITNGLHDRYYFVKNHAGENTVRFRPSPESSSKAVIFDFTKISKWGDEIQDGAIVIFENYMDITIVTQENYYYSFYYNPAQYIITRNCSRVRYIDGKNPTTGFPEKFNGNLEFTGTVNADVSSDTETPSVYKTVTVRFDRSIKGTNTRFATTTYYDCRPTMKNVTLGPNNIIVDSIVKCINSTLYGSFEFRYAKGTYNPLLYLQNCSFQVNSIKVVIYSESYLTGFESAKILESAFDENIIISGLDPETSKELLSKITIVKENDVKITTHKAVLTKDSKGILIVPTSFSNSNAPNIPSKYDPENPENYGNEDRIEDEFYIFSDEDEVIKDDESGDEFEQIFELNPSPPPAPTPLPSLPPLPTEVPTEPQESSTSSSSSSSSLPTEVPTEPQESSTSSSSSSSSLPTEVPTGPQESSTSSSSSSSSLPTEVPTGPQESSTSSSSSSSSLPTEVPTGPQESSTSSSSSSSSLPTEVPTGPQESSTSSSSSSSSLPTEVPTGPQESSTSSSSSSSSLPTEVPTGPQESSTSSSSSSSSLPTEVPTGPQESSTSSSSSSSLPTEVPTGPQESSTSSSSSSSSLPTEVPTGPQESSTSSSSSSSLPTEVPTEPQESSTSSSSSSLSSSTSTSTSNSSSENDPSYSDLVIPSNNGSGIGNDNQQESQNKKKKQQVAIIAGVVAGAVVIVIVVVTVVVIMMHKKNYVASSDGGPLPPSPEEGEEMDQEPI